MKKLSVKKSIQSTPNTSTSALVMEDVANAVDVAEGSTENEDGKRSKFESKVRQHIF